MPDRSDPDFSTDEPDPGGKNRILTSGKIPNRREG